MVTHNGRNVKLIDFGLADSDSSDILKFPAGTSGYIAPEQLLPGAKTDIRADVYSYGMVVKELAASTGSRLAAIAAACTRRDVARRRPRWAIRLWWVAKFLIFRRKRCSASLTTEAQRTY